MVGWYVDMVLGRKWVKVALRDENKGYLGYGWKCMFLVWGIRVLCKDKKSPPSTRRTSSENNLRQIV